MSVTLTARAIAEQALQIIGSFSPNDTAADGDDLARALSWLDIEVAHLAGTHRLQFLVEDTLVVALNANETSRTLADLLGSLTDIDMQFPVAASLIDDTGREYPVTIVRVDQYEAIPNKDDSGKPHTIYIDRQKQPTVYFYPTTTESGLSLRLTFVRFAPDLTKDKGNVVTLMRPAWNKWAIHALAGCIGAGPVRSLPLQRLQWITAIANDALEDLLGYENRQHSTQAPVAEAWGDYY